MYYEILAKIKNAQRARKDGLQVPFAKFDFEVLKLLAAKGFIDDVQKRSVGRKNVLDIRLKYKNGQPGVTDFRIQSKPSRRMYRGYLELRPIRQGYGLVVISTPSGVMTNTEARKKKVGGEYLFEIW